MDPSKSIEIPPESQTEIRELHDAFVAALVLKALNATLELAAGTLLLLIGSQTILHIVMRLTQNELIDDPHDFLANTLVHTATGYAATGSNFAALYLMGHGIIKLVLIGGIAKGYELAYPAFVGVMSLLVVYQLWRVFAYHSVWLLLFSVFDIIVIIIVAHEYLYSGKTGTQPV